MCTKIHMHVYQSYCVIQNGIYIKEIVQTQQIPKVVDACITYQDYNPS